MSPTKKSAAPEPARRGRRRWVFAVGAGLGWALAQLAGTLLDGELQTLRFLFLSLSALAGGLAALGAWTCWAGRRRLGAALALLALGAVLTLGLYLRFSVRVSYQNHTRSIAFLVGLSRSGLCECSADDAVCIQEMGLDPGRFRSCWENLWAVELALALSYLLTLGSAGTIAGLLMVPSRPPQSPETPQGYLDFDVWIDQKSEGLYRAKAWSGAAGFEAMECFALPSDLADGGRRRFGAGARRGGPGATGAADGAGPRQIGEELFRTVFQGELLRAFQGCLAKARRDRRRGQVSINLPDWRIERGLSCCLCCT